jgi:hypothetical protein
VVELHAQAATPWVSREPAFMLAALIIGAFILGVIAFDLVRTWWRQNAWRRRWRDRDADDLND